MLDRLGCVSPGERAQQRPVSRRTPCERIPANSGVMGGQPWHEIYRFGRRHRGGHGCADQRRRRPDKPTIAFVVNGPSDFWKLTEDGVATRPRPSSPMSNCSSAIPS